MKSIQLISKLKAVPEGSVEPLHTNRDFYRRLQMLNDRDVWVEASLYSSLFAYQLLNEQNVPDELFKAYEMQYPQLSENVSLYEKYVDAANNGEASITGLVSGIKGKAFELHVQENLTERYPDMEFQLSERANEPIWDIKGINDDGEEMLIQVKLMDPSEASNLARIMEAHPDVYYAASNELREKIMEINPSLEQQLIDIDISSYIFTQDVKDGLETLKENFGIDLPDEVFALAPYSTEIILGIKLLFDLASVQRDFSHVNTTEKSRLAAVKVLILISRFGVNTILSIAGASAGTAIFPGIGSVLGGIGGVVAGTVINKKIAPYSLDLAYKLLNIDEEDVFYYRNAEKVHDLALKFESNKLLLQHGE